MFIKQFRAVQVRVPDPLRPGKRAIEERLITTGCNGVSHGGVFFEADSDGWIDIEREAALHLMSFRGTGGEKFYTPEQVDEQVRLGAVDSESALPKVAKKNKSAV